MIIQQKSKGENKMKRAALINDLSGLGKCSLTAAIPVYASLGIQPCPLPTAILSNQTGYVLCEQSKWQI